MKNHDEDLGTTLIFVRLEEGIVRRARADANYRPVCSLP